MFYHLMSEVASFHFILIIFFKNLNQKHQFSWAKFNGILFFCFCFCFLFRTLNFIFRWFGHHAVHHGKRRKDSKIFFFLKRYSFVYLISVCCSEIICLGCENNNKIAVSVNLFVFVFFDWSDQMKMAIFNRPSILIVD